MNSYHDVMARKRDIVLNSVGIDYGKYSRGRLAFDYEQMLADTGYGIEEVRSIQRQVAVGNTPLVEMKNLSAIARSLSEPGLGARIFVKDEAANPSGSYKDRRASISAYEARRLGYPGIAAASSGNYGAAVASQACKYGLGSIIVQESFDSRGIEQPEIAEKTRACESYGAEVLRLSVGPELFYQFLLALEESGYYNASLYTPQAILGVESLGWEIVEQVKELTGKLPHTVIATNAGGGNLTGTARGLKAAGAGECRIVGASVDLQGLHMASDTDFNRKSFTTGHTGFSIPFTTWPDRSDVPRSAARPLRYMDRFVTVSQGEVFYMTQALAEMEGMERGPAGNTSLAAAFAMAQQIPEDEILVVQETEYTGAGKHPMAQLNLAKSMGIEVYRGNPEENVPGRRIVIPADPRQIQVKDIPMSRLQHSYLKHALEGPSLHTAGTELDSQDIKFLMAETGLDHAGLKDALEKVSHD